MTRSGWLLAILFGLFMLVYITSPRPKGLKSNSSNFPPGFSSWDGSNRDLVAKTKSIMNDPGSFEHVETRWEDQGQTRHVIMKYRGRNAFGGVVTQYQGAIVQSSTGQVVKLLD